jgi:hypothetical protein
VVPKRNAFDFAHAALITLSLVHVKRHLLQHRVFFFPFANDDTASRPSKMLCRTAAFGASLRRTVAGTRHMPPSPKGLINMDLSNRRRYVIQWSRYIGYCSRFGCESARCAGVAKENDVVFRLFSTRRTSNTSTGLRVVAFAVVWTALGVYIMRTRAGIVCGRITFTRVIMALLLQ